MQLFPFMMHDYHVHSTFSDGSGTIDAIIHTCAGRGIKEVAITDHVDEQGRFMYRPAFRGEASIDDYLVAIEGARSIAAARGIVLRAGVEVMGCTGDPSNPLGDDLLRVLERLAIIHVDGLHVDGVARVALDIAAMTHRVASPAPFTCISHPDFARVTDDEIARLVSAGVGFELNNAKFSPATVDGLERVRDLVEEMDLLAPLFVLGSDAHASADAGDVGLVAEHALASGLARWVHVFGTEK